MVFLKVLGVEHLLHPSVVTASGFMLTPTDLLAVATHLDHIPEGITR